MAYILINTVNYQGFIKVASIDYDGLFTNTELKVGLNIEAIKSTKNASKAPQVS